MFTWRLINGLVFGIFATKTWFFTGKGGMEQKQTIVVALGPVEISIIF